MRGRGKVEKGVAFGDGIGYRLFCNFIAKIRQIVKFMNDTKCESLEQSRKDALLQKIKFLYPQGLKDLENLLVNEAFTESDFYNMLDEERLQMMLNAVPSSRKGLFQNSFIREFRCFFAKISLFLLRMHSIFLRKRSKK
jgi:hypothetical protein